MDDNPTSTLTAAAAVLHELGIGELDELAQKAIERACLGEFLAHIADCQSGADRDGVSRRALEGLVQGLSIETIESICALGLTPNLDRLAVAANRQPTKLLSAIAASRNAAHPRHNDAIVYLRAVLAGQQVVAPTLSVVPPATSTMAPRQVMVQQEATGTISNSPSLAPGGGYASQPAVAAATTRTSPPYESEHVYGQGHAFTFNASIRNGHHGVMVDAAVATGPRRYNWADAVHIMLDAREVATALAVFKRRRDIAEFKGHGSSHEKCFSLEFQRSHFFARVIVRGQPPRAVQINPSDAMAVSLLFVKQLSREYPDVPIDTIVDLVMDVNDVGAPPGKSAA